MLDERREKVQTYLSDAEGKSKEAQEVKAELDEKLRSIETTARAKIQEAAREGQAAATEIRNQAREEARRIVSRAKDEAGREFDRGREQPREDVVKIALSAARKLVGESLDGPRQVRLVAEFVEGVEQAGTLRVEPFWRHWSWRLLCTCR